MSDGFSYLAGWFGLLFTVFAILQLFGFNLAPRWAMSRGFLIAACALIVAGMGSIA